jgi:hypothetical protein
LKDSREYSSSPAAAAAKNVVLRSSMIIIGLSFPARPAKKKCPQLKPFRGRPRKKHAQLIDY